MHQWPVSCLAVSRQGRRERVALDQSGRGHRRCNRRGISCRWLIRRDARRLSSAAS